MMNVQSMLRDSVQETVSEVAGACRVAVAPCMDPEKMERAPAFNVVCKNERLANLAEEHLSRTPWSVKRTGPNDLLVDPRPTFKPTASENYSSVWDD